MPCARSWKAPSRASAADPVPGRLADLSRRALHLAAMLPADDAPRLARWLYRFGTLPRGPAAERDFGPGDDPMAAGEHPCCRPFDPRRMASLPGAEPGAQVLQAKVAFEGAGVVGEAIAGGVAVTVAGKRVWEMDVAIPAAANIHDLRIPVDFDAPAGSAVEFHLHNHGYNSWRFVRIDLLD